jgi:hypothetical protein
MRVGPAAIVMLLMSCATTLADGAPYSFSDHPSQDGRCIGDNGVGEVDRSEDTCLKQIGELAQRHGPALQLKFRNGLTRVYVNEDAKCRSETADGCVKYQLTGYFPLHDLVLIEVDYWEGCSWLLVHADNGEVSEIVVPPHYSPSKRWLVSVAAGEGPSGPPNGIDVVPAQRDPALKEWHYRIPDDGRWLYQFDGWDGEDRINLMATSLGPPDRRIPASVERRNGTWHLNEPK